MTDPTDRRNFLKIAGASLGFGALYRVAPQLAAGAEGTDLSKLLGRKNVERPTPFSFVQLSDSHVGFNGPPNPLGTRAFERAVDMINGLPERPELVLFTGDLTHDSENPAEHAARMRLFQKIAGRLRVPAIKCVPGEHDAGLDGGALFRDAFGDSSYSFDHRGVHFIALDNVSQGAPDRRRRAAFLAEEGPRALPDDRPIVVFTHRPLFDLRPDWEWFTGDGDEVVNALAPHENVTVLYGHIHRENVHRDGHATHYAARSLIFAFPDPASGVPKKPLPFDKEQPFKNLGLRVVKESGGKPGSTPRPGIEEVELTLREFSGTVGIQQLLKAGVTS
ncbi:MAG TPA: metallophosphoesterase [Thermoanaerobaculia bacterium]|jgi:3',5'-cyclic AMP phosphodiesterase CpdA